MSTRATVAGFVDKEAGKVRDIVFNKTCNSLSEIQQAVEQAFDRGANTVVIRRIMPVGSRNG